MRIPCIRGTMKNPVWLERREKKIKSKSGESGVESTDDKNVTKYKRRRGHKRFNIELKDLGQNEWNAKPLQLGIKILGEFFLVH